MKSLYKIVYLIITLIFISCDQDPEFNYQEDLILQGYLIVGEPINDISLRRTLPLNVAYNAEQSTVSDANIIISDGINNYELTFNPETLKYEYLGDFVVQEEVEYTIEVTTPDNRTLTGTTKTPVQNEWVQLLETPLYFPIDSLNPPNTDRIFWDNKKVNQQSVTLTVKCLDTLNYGIYLDPPTMELNRRIERPWRSDFDFLDPVEFVVLPGSAESTPVVWSSFKFYGLHELAVYSNDFNWSRWSIQYYRQEYIELLSSIEGDGYGVFGSASVIRDTFFLVKNQP